MSTSSKRRDSKRRILRSGESIRADGRYQFKYYVNGKAKSVYSWRLEPTDKLPAGKKPCISLRELEKQIGYDLDDRMQLSKNMTVLELVDRYLATRTGVKPSTLAGYAFARNTLEKEDFSGKKIRDVRTSDAKLFLIKLQSDGKGYSTVKTVRGVLRPAFQMPLVAMHWEHRFNHMVKRYNDIYRVQLPNITPHVCRHTYCSNQAKSGMNPKTLQYLMGHSEIGVTMNVYTHLGFEDAAAELMRMEAVESARREQEKITGGGKVIKVV